MDEIMSKVNSNNEKCVKSRVFLGYNKTLGGPWYIPLPMGTDKKRLSNKRSIYQKIKKFNRKPIILCDFSVYLLCFVKISL